MVTKYYLFWIVRRQKCLVYVSLRHSCLVEQYLFSSVFKVCHESLRVKSYFLVTKIMSSHIELNRIVLWHGEKKRFHYSYVRPPQVVSFRYIHINLTFFTYNKSAFALHPIWWMIQQIIRLAMLFTLNRVRWDYAISLFLWKGPSYNVQGTSQRAGNSILRCHTVSSHKWGSLVRSTTYECYQ